MGVSRNAKKEWSEVITKLKEDDAPDRKEQEEKQTELDKIHNDISRLSGQTKNATKAAPAAAPEETENDQQTNSAQTPAAGGRQNNSGRQRQVKTPARGSARGSAGGEPNSSNRARNRRRFGNGLRKKTTRIEYTENQKSKKRLELKRKAWDLLDFCDEFIIHAQSRHPSLNGMTMNSKYKKIVRDKLASFGNSQNEDDFDDIIFSDYERSDNGDKIRVHSKDYSKHYLQLGERPIFQDTNEVLTFIGNLMKTIVRIFQEMVFIENGAMSYNKKDENAVNDHEVDPNEEFNPLNFDFSEILEFYHERKRPTKRVSDAYKTCNDASCKNFLKQAKWILRTAEVVYNFQDMMLSVMPQLTETSFEAYMARIRGAVMRDFCQVWFQNQISYGNQHTNSQQSTGVNFYWFPKEKVARAVAQQLLGVTYEIATNNKIKRRTAQLLRHHNAFTHLVDMISTKIKKNQAEIIFERRLQYATSDRWAKPQKINDLAAWVLQRDELIEFNTPYKGILETFNYCINEYGLSETTRRNFVEGLRQKFDQIIREAIPYEYDERGRLIDKPTARRTFCLAVNHAQELDESFQPPNLWTVGAAMDAADAAPAAGNRYFV